MSFPMIKKISTPFISVILQGTVLHTFPDDIWDKYSRENFSYTDVSVLRQHNTFLAQLRFLISNALARASATEKDTYIQKLKPLILVLGLLQVVGTVKS